VSFLLGVCGPTTSTWMTPLPGPTPNLYANQRCSMEQELTRSVVCSPSRAGHSSFWWRRQDIWRKIGVPFTIGPADRSSSAGGMANTLLKAEGVDVAASLVEDDRPGRARDFSSGGGVERSPPLWCICRSIGSYAGVEVKAQNAGGWHRPGAGWLVHRRYRTEMV